MYIMVLISLVHLKLTYWIKNSFWTSWVKTWALVGNKRFIIYSNIFIFDKNELFVHSSHYTEGNTKKM